MRLLTPAVLLVLFWNLATGSAADSRTSFSERQSPAILQTNNTNATALPASLPGQRAQETAPVATSAPESATITIPTGTKITLALTSPIWARTAKGGDPVYATTAFPVVSSKTMVIPAGTYVLGQIDSVTKPGWRTPRAEFLMHFSKIIFAGGYSWSSRARR